MESEKYLDTSIKLTTFYLKNVGLWLANSDGEQRQRNFALGYTLWATIFASFIVIRDLYYSWGDFNNVLYICCNTLSLFIVIIKLVVLIVHKMEFLKLILFMQEHFWKKNYNYQEKQIVDNARKTCIMFTVFVTLSSHCTMISYVVTPLIENLERNESDRLLPFNMWLDLPLSVTPYFEIVFFLQAIALYNVSIGYFCFDNILCLMSVHTSGQFRILQYKLAKLGDVEEETKDGDTRLTNYAHNCYEKFKSYIRYHHTLIDYCERLENVFTLIILVQVLAFSLLICLYGYQAFLANTSNTRRTIFILFLIGSMYMLFMFAYSSYGLIEESSNIGTAAYSARWSCMPMNEAGRKLRNDLITVILRSKRACCLTAYGYFPVSLETYTTILSTAVSYFTLLRQRSEATTQT